MALEKLPIGDRFIDRNMVSSVLFQPKFVAVKTEYPSRFWNSVRRAFGRAPLPERKIPVINSGPQITFTVAGGDGPFTINLGFHQDDEAEHIARWLRKAPNKFEAAT